LHFRHAAFRIVRAGEMGHFNDFADFGALLQRVVSRGIVVREKAGAVHAAVHFQPHGCRLLPIVRQAVFQLRLLVDDRP